MWTQQGLNLRPLPYEGIATDQLSYESKLPHCSKNLLIREAGLMSTFRIAASDSPYSSVFRDTRDISESR